MFSPIDFPSPLTLGFFSQECLWLYISSPVSGGGFQLSSCFSFALMKGTIIPLSEEKILCEGKKSQQHCSFWGAD